MYTFGYRQGPIPDFEKYFHELRYNNYTRSNKQWIGEYWQETHQCNLPDLKITSNYTKNCSGNEDNSIYKDFAPVHVVINAVYAIANALDSMQKDICPNVTGICLNMSPISTESLLYYIQNTTFLDALSRKKTSFNRYQEVDGSYTIYNYRQINGSYDYVPVSSWSGKRVLNFGLEENFIFNKSRIQLAHVNTSKPLFVCKPDCRHNQIRSYLSPDHCCWECESCQKYEIAMNDTCIPCELGFTSRKNSSSCIKMNLVFINMNTNLAITIAVFSALGIIVDLISFITFLVYRNHPLIKASGREMCCIMFLAITLMFISSVTTLIKPTTTLCSVRRILPGISFTTCYAPLFVKILRIYGIFQRAKRFKRLSSGGLFSIGPMLALTFILIVIDIIFSYLLLSVDPSATEEKFYEDKEELVLECTTNTTTFISIFAYNLLLLFGCTLYAFLTRHFPKNFNEARNIGITMYFTCVVWAVFFANFLNSNYSISRVYWLSGCSLLIGWITLLGLFGAKFYHVFTKVDVGRDMLIAWNEQGISRSESETSHFQCEECKRRAFITSNGIRKDENSTEKVDSKSKNDSSLTKHNNGVTVNESFDCSGQVNGEHNLAVLKDTQF